MACLFCDAEETTAEHLWPRWLQSVLPDLGLTTFQVETRGKPAREWKGRPASITAKVVCSSCNNGWMSQLETAAQPLLTPLILGRRITLDKPQQRTMAAWALKTGIMLEQINPKTVKVPHEHRRHLFECGEPPETVHVFAAAWDGKEWQTTYRDCELLIELPPESREDPHAYVKTLGIGHLAFQVIGSLIVDATFQIRGPITDVVHQIWPFRSSLKWPPSGDQLTSKGFLDLANHWRGN